MEYLLTKPLDYGKLRIKNRLVMPPMATSKSDTGGYVSRDLLKYYDEKTSGGYMGLVIVEHSFVSAAGKASANQLSAASDDIINGLSELAETIKRNGCKAVLQLNHAGSAATKEITGLEPVGPSAVPNPSKPESAVPLELTQTEIGQIVQDFAKAAGRAKKAGFDGVEIHSCHGYLLNQFLSPLSNHRNDCYGGDIEKRIRVHLEVIGAVRSEVGEDFPVLFRLGATDHMEGGITLEDSIEAAQAFEKAGLDMLDISGGMCRYTISGVDLTECFSQLSKAIKGALSIPVIVTGGVTDVMQAEELLKDNRADLVGVGRAILKDSNWAKNAIEALQSSMEE